MLLCGDFRQILPVIQGGTRGNIVDACLKRSHLWDSVVVKQLHTNMRVHLCGDVAAGQFAEELLAIGDGKFPIDTLPDVVQLPDTMGTFVDSKEELVPTEFLNSLEVSGLPQHLLLLKVGAPIIILRSLDPPRVTNGTRCVVTKLSANTVEAKISHGRYAGHDIIIPRIPLIPSNSVLPFEFRRLQFSIALCFAMTINKSQDQTFKAVGLDLTDESFTHGMLYVALSRVGSADRLTLLVRGDCKTRNVVYSEVFT